MKEFNLEDAKAGKPVCTRQGYPVRILCFDRLHQGGHVILGLIKERDDFESAASWKLAGQYYLDRGDNHDADLFMAEETIEINGHKVPKPETEAPEFGTKFYAPILTGAGYITSCTWDDGIFGTCVLRRGLVHLTKEAAIKHAEALLSFTEKAG